MKKNLAKIIKAGMVTVLFAAIAVMVRPQTVVRAADEEDAVSIELGEEISDSISEETEEDWYTFTTPTTESGADSWFKVTIMYSNKKERGYAPSVYLYDEKKKEVAHVSANGENEEKAEYILLAQDSTYYVMVASEYHNDTADYLFSITELPDEAGEALEKAANLEKNMTNRFEMQSGDDEDWFYVESDITKPSITVKNANVVSLTIGIYDIDGVQLDEFDVDREESETVKLELEDKNFYVRVYTYYATTECMGNYTIAVNDQVKVTRVSINKSKVELKTGKSLTLNATVTPENATDTSVNWKSSDTKIATVDKNGKVVTKKAGTVTITCTANDGSGKKATCKITVK